MKTEEFNKIIDLLVEEGYLKEEDWYKKEIKEGMSCRGYVKIPTYEPTELFIRIAKMAS
jgi:hypothetical protein